MPAIKETLEYRQGRLGEILQIAMYMHYGLRIIDVGGSTNNRAPLLHHRDLSLVAADGLAIRTGPAFIEFKTKRHHFDWRGGAPDDPVKVPARTEEGIDLRSYRQYRAVREETNIPFVLSFLSIEDGELLCAAIDELPLPRISQNTDFPLANWDVRSFRRAARFDPQRLDHFFRDPRADRWLDDLPSDKVMLRIVEYLRPRDQEFKFYLEHIFDQIERGWHRK
jgi:hypothetical protein